MTEASFFKVRLYFLALVTVAIESLLTWNYLHGGIPRHHILADENLPEISNAWGGLVLPVLTWRIQKRVFRKAGKDSEIDIQPVVWAFVCSLLYATIMAVSFSFGYSAIISNMMLAIVGIALFFPIYRSEYLLGFVLGMTVTFGAILPTGIGSILCAIGAVMYLGVRKGVLYLVGRGR